MLSPSLPPFAAKGLLTETDSKIYDDNGAGFPTLLNFMFDVVVIALRVLAKILLLTPPPVRYLTVKVVLTGVTP